MKTKITKLALLLGLGLITTKITNAQHSYIDINIGYGFGTNGTNGLLFNSSITETQDSYSEKTENAKLSLGKGLNFGANYGYMFSENIGVDFGLNYHLGSKTTGTETTDHSYYDDWTGEYYITYEKTETSYYSNMFQINPSLVLAQKFETITLYSKIGVVMGMGSITELYESKGHSNQVPESFKYTHKLTGGMAAGFSASLGSQFHLSENLSLIAEVNYSGLNYSPTKGQYSQIIMNGEDITSQFEKEDLNYVLVDELVYHSGTNSEETPKQLKNSFSYSSLGLKFGVRFNL